MDAGHFFMMCGRYFQKFTERRKLTASLCIFVVPTLWNSSDKNGVTGLQNSYPDVIAALILFELVYLQGSASFVQYDSGIFEYFAKLQ